MKRTMFRTLTVLAALSAGLVPAVAAAADDVTDHIDTWITERMEAHGIPGAAVAVIDEATLCFPAPRAAGNGRVTSAHDHPPSHTDPR